MSAAPWAFYRCTHLGLATSAMAENQRAASAIGLSPDRIAAANWALGSALAGVATILIGGGRVHAAVLAVTVLLTFWVIMSAPDLLAQIADIENHYLAVVAGG